MINKNNKHIYVLFVLVFFFLLAVFLLRWFFTSEIFGGRRIAIDYIAEESNRELVYLGNQNCKKCHKTEYELVYGDETRRHKGNKCENCHGPGMNSYTDRSNGICLRCHNDILSREDKVSKIELASHLDDVGAKTKLENKRCISCHNPHSKLDEEWIPKQKTLIYTSTSKPEKEKKQINKKKKKKKKKKKAKK
jgi:hypothetical protein